MSLLSSSSLKHATPRYASWDRPSSPRTFLFTRGSGRRGHVLAFVDVFPRRTWSRNMPIPLCSNMRSLLRGAMINGFCTRNRINALHLFNSQICSDESGRFLFVFTLWEKVFEYCLLFRHTLMTQLSNLRKRI